jgi:hypothetical protein
MLHSGATKLPIAVPKIRIRPGVGQPHRPALSPLCGRISVIGVRKVIDTHVVKEQLDSIFIVYVIRRRFKVTDTRCQKHICLTLSRTKYNDVTAQL